MVETKRHGDAFDEYYAMGSKRSYASLADHLNVTDRTIKRWAKEFNWQERIVQRDYEINRKTEEKTNKAIVNTKADYRAEIGKDLKELDAIGSRIIKLLADVADKLTPGMNEKGEVIPPAIEIKSVEDLNKMVSSLKQYRDIKKDLVKLDMELIGESEGLRDVSINIAEAIMDGNYYKES